MIYNRKAADPHIGEDIKMIRIHFLSIKRGFHAVFSTLMSLQCRLHGLSLFAIVKNYCCCIASNSTQETTTVMLRAD